MLIEESILLRDSAQEILSQNFAGQELSRIEGLVLTAIAENDRAMTAPQVGRILGHSRQVMKRAVDSLVEQQLVEKHENPDHKTAMLLTLTPRGKEYTENTGKILVDVVSSLLTDADIELCQKMGRELKRLRGLIEDYSVTERKPDQKL